MQALLQRMLLNMSFLQKQESRNSKIGLHLKGGVQLSLRSEWQKNRF